MAKTTASNEITSVCTNYQELFQSEDFTRVIQIAIKKSGCFNEEAILSVFKKLGKGEELSEQEKINLTSFADNKNVEDAVTPILAKLSESSLPGTQNLEQHKSFGEILEGVFTEDGFETTKNGILEQAGVDVSERVSDTITLSPEALEVQKKFDTWLADNEEYATQHKIQENVRITNDGIELGGQVLRWRGHQFGGVNVESDADLNKQPYTIEEMVAMIQALGGKQIKLQDRYKLGGNEISSFLSEVAGIELGRFYWSSSYHESNGNRAWGVVMLLDGVYVGWGRRHYGFSSLSSQN